MARDIGHWKNRWSRESRLSDLLHNEHIGMDAQGLSADGGGGAL